MPGGNTQGRTDLGGVMSNTFDEAAASAPTSREGMQAPYGMPPQQQQPYYGGPEMYGYGGPMYGRRFGGGYGGGGRGEPRPTPAQPLFLQSGIPAAPAWGRARSVTPGPGAPLLPPATTHPVTAAGG